MSRPRNQGQTTFFDPERQARSAGKPGLTLILLAWAAGAAGFDAGGVSLGAAEADIKRAYPSAHCKPLEWKSAAADRRCDDARISFGGAKARITFYLKAGAVEAFTVRFDARDLELVKKHLRSGWGAPIGEATEVIARSGGEDRRIFKMRWEKGAARAVLTAPEKSRRATLEAWRGNFDAEIYRVR